MNGPPATEPIGLQLTRTSKVVGRAFDDALATTGGTLPTWQILVSLMNRHAEAQRELAQSLGIEGPTMTHHLDRLEAAGYLTRTRDPQNRRVHRVELTELGKQSFHRMRVAVAAFDQQLREGFTLDDLAALVDLLARLRANVAAPDAAAAADTDTASPEPEVTT
jgi:MarR family transcriptional regulator, transcriptional regulator for hemolysin